MAHPQPRLSPEEYLAFERESETKHEYLDGEIFAMSGASRRHNLISLNVGAQFWNQFRNRSCESYTSDMRVRIPATGLYTYPDVVVVCEEPTFDDGELDTLTNPTLLVEVLSPSTADYDRGAKFGHYRTIPSLREVLFIAQDEVHVVHYRRQDDDTWLLVETRDLEGTVELPKVGASLSVAEVYAKVPFGAA